MKKRILAGMLALLMIFTLASCKALGGDDEDDVKAPGEDTDYNFLVLGHDRAANLTDVIMLISFHTDDGTLTILQIPRDTFVDYGGNNYKINSMYATYYNRSEAENRALDAARSVADTLEQTLCVKIHYATVMDLDGFAAIVDAIGGVEMNVPYRLEYHDSKQGLDIDLYPGQQTLNGKTAEQFVRFRSGFANADIGRGNAQKMFMTAFISSFKKNLKVSALRDIATAVSESLDTELTVNDMVYFAKSALSLDLSGVTMLTLPGAPVTSANSGASFYVMNREAVIETVNQYYNIYDFEITDSIFDPDRDFCNTTDVGMESAYYAAAEEAMEETYNGQEISENGIAIPLK